MTRATSLAELGRNEAAIECYDKALEIDPEFSFSWFGKGLALTELRRFEGAIGCYDKALEIDPDDAASWNNRGHLLGTLGRVDVAQECYRRVLDLKSTTQHGTLCRCEAEFALHHWGTGFVALRDALERYPVGLGRDNLAYIIELVLGGSQTRELRRRNIDRLIAIPAEAGLLVRLGENLIRSLRLIYPNRHDVRTLEDWREDWRELGAGHADLEIPLRIFGVGIEYLIRGDEKVLLDLVSVERRVLRQALGLEDRRGGGLLAEPLGFRWRIRIQPGRTSTLRRPRRSHGAQRARSQRLVRESCLPRFFRQGLVAGMTCSILLLQIERG